MSNVENICRFAVACHYKKHDHFAIENNRLTVVQDSKSKVSTLGIVSQIIAEREQCGSLQDRQLIDNSLRLIRNRCQNKLNSCFARFFYDTGELRECVKMIDKAVKERLPQKQNEALFRLRFLSSLPSQIGVKDAPGAFNQIRFQWRNGKIDRTIVDEWRVLKWLSEHVFNSEAVQSLPPQERQKKYNEIMLGAYKGDHLLIEEDKEGTKSKQLNEFAIIRGSSHYENGREIVRWDERGKACYAPESHKSYSAATVPHYGITGKHVKHILYNAVEVQFASEGGQRQLVAHKTAQQVQKLIEKNSISLRCDANDTGQFVALQFESSPDCEGNNWRCLAFYTHRLYGFITYRLLLKFGIKAANVGAYGFGRTGDDPVILAQRKFTAITV